MVQLTPVAITKVKEILTQQNPVADGLARRGRGRRLLRLQLPHGLRKRRQRKQRQCL